MDYTYSSLLPSSQYSKTLSRRAVPFTLQWRTVSLVCITLMFILLGWLESDRRHTLAAPASISCQKEPWYLFPAKASTLPKFNETEWAVSPKPDSVDNSRTPIQWPKIAHLQTCTHPDASSSYLLALLDNHREYCRNAGIEYSLRSGDAARGGAWSKIYALIDKLEEELVKPEGERIEWIFIADIDTLFVDPEVRVEAVLPPKHVTGPFLLANQDYNGFNAGSLFFRVDQRSLRLAKKALTFSPWPLDPRLWLAEQAAMKIIFEEEKLVETGQVVYISQDFLNNYNGEKVLNGSIGNSTAAVVHFPSKRVKRDVLFPLLHKMVLGGGPRLSHKQIQQRNDNIRLAAKLFWDRYEQHKRTESIVHG